MIVVEVAERSDLFEFAALYAIRTAGGNPWRLFFALGLIAAAVSMFLSDSTAMLIIAAATTTITKLLDYEPTPYFIASAVMINLGGTSTLIGSVSNMVIGVEAGLSFSDFIGYLAICEIALWALTLLTLYAIFKSRLGEKKTLPSYNPWEGVEDRKRFYRSALVLILLLFLSVTLERWGGPEAVALGCAILALAISGLDPTEVFRGVDWETVFFLASFLFIIGGFEKTGILSAISQRLFQTAKGSPLGATLLTIWSSGLASAIISNIAVTLTFIPIIHELGGSGSTALWSALVLGTNLGGAATPLSGSVCIMAIGALKQEGIALSFGEFSKVGTLTTLVQLGFATLYLILRFGLGG